MIRSNRRLTVREISENLNISYGSVQNILTTDLIMRQVSAKFVPHVLMVEKSNSFCQFHWSCSIVLFQTQAFWEMSSREMKLGSMVMILRPGCRVLDGNHPVLVWKNRFKQYPTSSWWWLCFVILMELYEMHLIIIIIFIIIIIINCNWVVTQWQWLFYM